MTKVFCPGTIALGLILAVLAGRASAQTDAERSGARAAGLAGLEAFDAHNYSQAADYFERAERLMHAPTHLLYLARSNAKLGRLVSARESYLRLAQERLPSSASKPFRDAQAAGDKELNELEPRLPYVSLVVQGAGTKDVQVTRDGEPISAALLGVPHPEDPGSHTYKAQAERMESAPTTLVLKEGAHETVLLTLLRTAPERTAAPAPSTSGANRSAAFGSDVTTDSPSSNGVSGLRIASYVGIGLGAVGAGIGTYFLVTSGPAQTKADDFYNQCSLAKNCSEPANTAEVHRLDNDAQSKRTVGAVGLIAGGALLATGVTLLIVDLSNSHSARSEARHGMAGAALWPVLGASYAGISGRF